MTGKEKLHLLCLEDGQKSEFVNGAALQNEKNALVESPKADKEAEQKISNTIMPEFNQNPVTESSEQGVVQATVESVNNSMIPQGSATPDSNSSSERKVSGAAITTALENGISVNYYDFLSAGGKFAYLDKNRTINESHVMKFVESFKRVGCLNSIKVVVARKVIEEGHTIRDRAGNILSLATPNMDMYYCIIDGQHKADALALWIANEETKNIPLVAKIEMVNIPQGVSIGAYIGEFNLVCQKWSHRDTQALLGQTFEKEGTTILSRIESCVNEDKMSQRGAWKIYKMNDVYKKSKYEDALFKGKLSDELRGTAAELERGDRILRSIRVACRQEVRMKKNSAIIDVVIAAYNAVSDTQKIEIMDQLMLFVTSLPAQTLATAMQEDSVSKKTDVITQAWKNFQKELKKDGKREEYEALALNAEEEYDKVVSSLNLSRKSSNLDKIKKVLL